MSDAKKSYVFSIIGLFFARLAFCVDYQNVKVTLYKPNAKRRPKLLLFTAAEIR